MDTLDLFDEGSYDCCDNAAKKWPYTRMYVQIETITVIPTIEYYDRYI